MPKWIFRLVAGWLFVVLVIFYNHNLIGLDEKPVVFTWSVDKCPSFEEMAKDGWNSNDLNTLLERLEGCSAIHSSMSLNKSMSIERVQYSYDFTRMPKDSRIISDVYYIENVTYNFLVLKPTNLILWEGGYTNTERDGAVTNITFHRIALVPIMEFELAVGGSGGYWEEYYTYSNGKLVQFKEHYLEDAKRLVPHGYEMIRPRVNIENLTATIYLRDSKTGYPVNGSIELKVALQNENIVMVDGKLVP